ncbi:energy transducer TonB [Thioclava dalianensis]|uniref:Energy transducer TonB n=1 Tax=Thioclava dalianensis TaxID=1185766 RepID=A0A074U0Y8_9RHOB|nr:TonB family protein [Thioclava dalianensis]KEP68317.1 energy transducer TonB [Thioclava dalianensis]SFN81210.1 protein TonB [Thioclava dalianensis]
MRVGRCLEAGVFLALALVLMQALFFALRADVDGASAAGSGGEDLVSLKPASAAVEGMIARFEDPLRDQPVRTQFEQMSLPDPVVMPAPAPPLELPPQAQLPELDLAPPPQLAARETSPETDAAPETSLKPMSKPARQPVARKQESDPEPAPRKPQRASAPSAAQTAAGSGGSTNAGERQTSRAATLSKGQEQNLRAQWGASIRARIEARKRYPSAAGRARGSVTVQLTVTRSGQLAGVSVAGSSGNAALDQAALQAVQRAQRFAAAPAGLTQARYSFALTIRFAR